MTFYLFYITDRCVLQSFIAIFLCVNFIIGTGFLTRSVNLLITHECRDSANFGSMIMQSIYSFFQTTSSLTAICRLVFNPEEKKSCYSASLLCLFSNYLVSFFVFFILFITSFLEELSVECRYYREENRFFCYFSSIPVLIIFIIFFSRLIKNSWNWLFYFFCCWCIIELLFKNLNEYRINF